MKWYRKLRYFGIFSFFIVAILMRFCDNLDDIEMQLLGMLFVVTITLVISSLYIEFFATHTITKKEK